ncbi:ABC transporter permease [Candidatus Saccharibacteria bacterium]|nr:ABC transporter permease [Candidatus Saccharibacteria bacterium]
MIRYLLFILRRERLMTPIWIASLLAASIGIAIAFQQLFATPEDMRVMAETLANPAMQALIGPTYGIDSLTPAMLMAQELLIFMIITVAIFNIFLVIRHTRTDEEQGRLEMLRALPIGRLTNPAATLLFAFKANLAITLAIALGLIATNMDGMQVCGAFIYAGSIGASGFLFASIALLMAQLFSTSRGALSGSFALMGVFYIARAFGDMSGNILSYISPMGLGLRVYSFYDNIAWPILVLFVQAIIIGGIALLVCRNRDLGEGIIPASKGRRHASRFLQTPFGLAWNLSKGNFLAWTIGLFALGATYGAVIGDIAEFVQTNEMFQTLLGLGQGDLITYQVVESFISMILVVMAMVAAIPVVIIANKIRSEEKQGRIEPIFARAIRRRSLLATYTIIAAFGSAWFIFITALGLYAGGANTGLLNFSNIVHIALFYVPAILVMLGMAVFLVGFLPKLTSLVWVIFGYSFLTVYFGSLLGLPEWMDRLSPFGYHPDLEASGFVTMPFIVLSTTAIALILMGFQAYRSRDLVG